MKTIKILLAMFGHDMKRVERLNRMWLYRDQYDFNDDISLILGAIRANITDSTTLEACAHAYNNLILLKHYHTQSNSQRNDLRKQFNTYFERGLYEIEIWYLPGDLFGGGSSTISFRNIGSRQYTSKLARKMWQQIHVGNYLTESGDIDEELIIVLADKIKQIQRDYQKSNQKLDLLRYNEYAKWKLRPDVLVKVLKENRLDSLYIKEY